MAPLLLRLSRDRGADTSPKTRHKEGFIFFRASVSDFGLIALSGSHPFLTSSPPSRFGRRESGKEGDSFLPTPLLEMGIDSPIERSGDELAGLPPCLGDRCHLHSAPPRMDVSGGDDRLVFVVSHFLGT